MKYLLKILAFIPLTLHLLLLSLLTIFKKVTGISWISIPIIILLFIISYGIISNKKILRKISDIALIILTVLLCILGYYDFIQWFSSIVGIILFIYFMIIKMLIKKQRNIL